MQDCKDWPFSDRASAGGSLLTTAKDYATFLIEIMQPSAVDSYRLTQETVSQMLSSQVQVNSEASWGLGWGLQKSEAGDSFRHWGDYEGFKNYAVGFAEQKAGVVILTNGANGHQLIEETILPSVGVKGSYEGDDCLQEEMRSFHTHFADALGAQFSSGLGRRVRFKSTWGADIVSYVELLKALASKNEPFECFQFSMHPLGSNGMVTTALSHLFSDHDLLKKDEYILEALRTTWGLLQIDIQAFEEMNGFESLHLAPANGNVAILDFNASVEGANEKDPSVPGKIPDILLCYPCKGIESVQFNLHD